MRRRLAALAAAVALPLALGCGSGSSTTKPVDTNEYNNKMKDVMEKQMKDRKAAMTTPTGK